MKIPNKLKISGITYKISFPKKMRSKDGNYYSDGKVDISEQWIKFSFDKSVGKEYREMIFFHELTHLLFYYTGTGKWDNEKEVHSFAAMLYQILNDNNLLK